MRALVKCCMRLPSWQIIVLGVGVRLIFCVAAARFRPVEYAPLAGDTYLRAGSDGYIQLARTMLEAGQYAFRTGGLPVHNRPPVHVFLLIVFGAWSVRYWFYFWFLGSALLFVVLSGFLIRCARCMDIQPAWTHVMIAAVAFHPYLIFISKTNSAVLEAMVLLAMLAYCFAGIKDRPWRYAVSCGVVSGLGCLTHGSFMLVPFLVVLFILRLLRGQWKKAVQVSMIYSIATLAVVSPWTIRNYVTFHEFIPVVTNKGLVYWAGERKYFGTESDPTAKRYRQATGKPLVFTPYHGTLHPEDDALLWRWAKEDMLRRPLHIIYRLLFGAAAFWAPWDVPRKALVCGLLNYPLLVSLIVLFWRRTRDRSVTIMQCFLFAVTFYFNFAIGFFAYGSYFTFLLPNMILLFFSMLDVRGETPGAMGAMQCP